MHRIGIKQKEPPCEGSFCDKRVNLYCAGYRPLEKIIAETQKMPRILRSFFRSFRKSRTHYEPLITVAVYASTLKKNYAAFCHAYPSVRFAPVLKSNAYGHGMVEVARIFDAVGAPFFVVDSYVEALILRNENIQTPILIIGYTLSENILRSRLKNVAFTVGNIMDLKALCNARERRLTLHLKIDSGMHRQGMMPDEVSEALSLLKQSPHIHLEGVGTHLADPDGLETSATDVQIHLWNTLVDTIRAEFPSCAYIHCAATEGAKFSKQVSANVGRIGMGLYGCTKSYGSAVVPALEMRTIVTSIRRIRKGESVGYNFTYTAPRDMIIATVPVGYAEGIDRRLSNNGFFTIRNTPCPIVGRVSMNITSLDVTDMQPEVALREEVVAISKERDDVNSCESLAQRCQTIPYEMLVHIPSTLRRILHDEL